MKLEQCGEISRNLTMQALIRDMLTAGVSNPFEQIKFSAQSQRLKIIASQLQQFILPDSRATSNPEGIRFRSANATRKTREMTLDDVHNISYDYGSDHTRGIDPNNPFDLA